MSAPHLHHFDKKLWSRGKKAFYFFVISDIFVNFVISWRLVIIDDVFYESVFRGLTYKKRESTPHFLFHNQPHRSCYGVK